MCLCTDNNRVSCETGSAIITTPPLRIGFNVEDQQISFIFHIHNVLSLDLLIIDHFTHTWFARRSKPMMFDELALLFKFLPRKQWLNELLSLSRCWRREKYWMKLQLSYLRRSGDLIRKCRALPTQPPIPQNGTERDCSGCTGVQLVNLEIKCRYKSIQRLPNRANCSITEEI